MLCYRDQTFCSSDCTNESCFRHWDESKDAAAQKWWGKPGAPVAFSDFSDNCAGYTPPKEGGVEIQDKIARDSE